MENNPAMEVGLKGQETTNQIFLSPIENFPYIKENNLFLSIEYYLCTGISVFLWNYLTISAIAFLVPFAKIAFNDAVTKSVTPANLFKSVPQ